MSSTFELTREHKIPSLNIHLQEFTHTSTGAKHIHMQADSEENVFLVALRTVPHDSSGVAHILEHTALCGSKKYPVRDPFFMMTRRSLNTFMNAFTSSDWTAYPFASFNRKDFNNLLDVYLDAVFFSRLDRLDFAQEGHRLEFAVAEDPQSELTYKGVVFNEMKGAMSSVNSQLWQAVNKYLHPNSTYHYNSGGEPEHIVDLSYEDLLDFYQSHYHPSNATFMTFGDIPASEHQQKFETQVLCHFERGDTNIHVQSEKRLVAPIRVQEYYGNTDSDLNNKTHVVVAWLLGDSIDLEQLLRAQLLTGVLLDNAASPLMHVLESSDLGQAPSPMCGLDDSQKEMSFMCGLAGANEHSVADVETLIIDSLRDIAERGVPQAEIEAALHQIELHQREITGDSYPYGLQLILKALSCASHRGDPIALLDLDKALQKLRSEIEDPQFIPALIREFLLDNPHRVTLSLLPSNAIPERKIAAEKQQLAALKAQLSAEQKQHIVDQALALKARQDRIDDADILPKVGLDDVPVEERDVTASVVKPGPNPLYFYQAGTNGLMYQQIITEASSLNFEQLRLMPLFNQCLTELGTGEKSYLDVQREQSACSGGVSAFNIIRGRIDDPNALMLHWALSSKALSANQRALNTLMSACLHETRFDEYQRMRELVSQARIGMEQGVVGNGHGLAMTAAAAGISRAAQLQHEFSGLLAVRALKALDQDIKADPARIEAVAEQFKAILQALQSPQKIQLLIGDESILAAADTLTLRSETDAAERSAAAWLNGTFETKRVNEAWLTNAEVNYCAKAYATVPSSHPDAAVLVVLSHFLRNGFLHKAIREQGGAYGGGSSQDNNSACFRFYSYRDPRIAETLQDFDRSIAWLLETSHSQQQLEEAILGTISSLDRSESPAGQAKRCFYAELHGRTLALRQQFREQVLGTRLDDLRTVAERYLQPERAHVAVVSGQARQVELRDLGFAIEEL